MMIYLIIKQWVDVTIINTAWRLTGGCGIDRSRFNVAVAVRSVAGLFSSSVICIRAHLSWCCLSLHAFGSCWLPHCLYLANALPLTVTSRKCCHTGSRPVSTTLEHGNIILSNKLRYSVIFWINDDNILQITNHVLMVGKKWGIPNIF